MLLQVRIRKHCYVNNMSLILHYDAISSTNTIARAFKKYSNAVIISSNSQKSGFGRNGKSWFGDSYQNIYLSIALSATLLKNHIPPFYYQACSVLAVQASLLLYLSPDMIRIKYPNDIYVRQNMSWKKISGILIQTEYIGSHLESIVIGIGLNVFQQKFDETIKDKAISLSQILDDDDNLVIQSLQSSILSNLFGYLEYEEQNIYNLWCDALNIIGKDITIVKTGDSAIVESIGNNGTLHIIQDHKKLYIDNGDSIYYDLN
jgi:BirA family transcriptional regulator, biotin operon repressor / biotin---[acetyl-CoA-carboxylase] ligase